MYLPLTIGIGGSKSRVGKTTFIEEFINFVKKINSKLSIVAIKYSKNSLNSSIIKDISIIEQENKDTSRIKKAGADYVFWVIATEEDLQEVVSKLTYEILTNINYSILIIEGNSLVKAIQPDVIIFFKDNSETPIKPSGKELLNMADIIIEGKYSMEEVMTEIENVQMKKIIRNLLQERSNENKITCSEARKIAEELNVPYIEVGKVANELKIKIRKCELGCF